MEMMLFYDSDGGRGAPFSLARAILRRQIADTHHFVRHPSVISPLTCEVALLVASDLLAHIATNEHSTEEDTPSSLTLVLCSEPLSQQH